MSMRIASTVTLSPAITKPKPDLVVGFGGGSAVEEGDRGREYQDGVGGGACA